MPPGIEAGIGKTVQCPPGRPRSDEVEWGREGAGCCGCRHPGFALERFDREFLAEEDEGGAGVLDPGEEGGPERVGDGVDCQASMHGGSDHAVVVANFGLPGKRAAYRTDRQ